MRFCLALLLCSFAVASCADDVRSMLSSGSAVGMYALGDKPTVAAANDGKSYGYILRKKHVYDKGAKHSDKVYEAPHKYDGHDEPRYKGYAPEHYPEGPKYEYHPEGPHYHNHGPEHEQYHHEEHYGSQESYSYHDEGVKLCLHEVSRSPPGTFPAADATVPVYFQSFFSCCKGYGAAEIVGNCNLTATPLTPPAVTGQLGKVAGTCGFTAPGPCVPHKLIGRTFSLSDTVNQTFWLETDAALSTDSYPYGVYVAGDKASTAADRTVKPAHYEDHEYEYEPMGSPIEATEGKATVFTAMIVPKTGLLKGGTFEFIAGFVDKDGNVLCPANVASPVNPPTVAGGVLPLVKCGEYKLKLWFAPEDYYYTDYNGNHHEPYNSYYEDVYNSHDPKYPGEGPEYYYKPGYGPGEDYHRPGY